MRAAAELGIRTVAIFAAEGRFALRRFKADERYRAERNGTVAHIVVKPESVLRSC